MASPIEAKFFLPPAIVAGLEREGPEGLQGRGTSIFLLCLTSCGLRHHYDHWVYSSLHCVRCSPLISLIGHTFIDGRAMLLINLLGSRLY
jgi:hypothetical protein